MARDIYIAIMVAAAKGKSMVLSVDEVFALSIDDAIATRASNALDESDWPEHADDGKPASWATIDPNKKREALNLASVAPEDRASARRCDCVSPPDAEWAFCRCERASQPQS